MDLPGNLNAAVARLVNAEQGLRDRSFELTAAYKAGRDSGHINLAAYLATRLPATYAANRWAMDDIQALRPDFAPTSVLDVGAGPGTASWAALARWPAIEQVTQVEKMASFAALAKGLNAESQLPALMAARVQSGSVLRLDAATKADLVLASYVLAELPMPEIPAAAESLWRCAHDTLLLIEPGTPDGFARLRLVRDELIKRGANVLAPCTHQGSCPMIGKDWCHFKVRLQRSRTHMQAKNAVVPFEDEAFSYLVLQRRVSQQTASRVIAPVTSNKVAVTLQICTASGLQHVAVASRDKPAYKQAKKIVWGDLWE